MHRRSILRAWLAAVAVIALSYAVHAQEVIPLPTLESNRGNRSTSQPSPQPERVFPEVLRPPGELLELPEPSAVEWTTERFYYPMEAPLGFTGPTGVAPSEGQSSAHFVPIEDRWRMGFPEWDRYGRGHPLIEDYPYTEGAWWDPV